MAGERYDAKTWLAIRTAFVVKRWSASKCAEEFKVDVTTIKKRASKEGWTHERNRNATAGQSVAEDEARQAVALEAERRQQLIDGLSVWVAAKIKACDDILIKITNPRSQISATRDIVEMVDRLVTTFKKADQDRPLERDDELVIEQRRIETYRVAVGADGRMIPELPPGDADTD